MGCRLARQRCLCSLLWFRLATLGCLAAPARALAPGMFHQVLFYFQALCCMCMGVSPSTFLFGCKEHGTGQRFHNSTFLPLQCVWSVCCIPCGCAHEPKQGIVVLHTYFHSMYASSPASLPDSNSARHPGPRKAERM